MAEAKPTVEIERVEFTEKQIKHINKLKAAIDNANIALQNFAVYLADEYDVKLDGNWVIGEKGFERPKEPKGEGTPDAE